MPYSPGTNLLRRLAMGVASSISTSLACAQTTGDASTEAKKESPWLLVPKISSNPQIGTSVGGVGRWSDDAPTGAYSNVALRGYTQGQYLAPNSVMAEGELRWNLTGKWGLHLFGGVSCLYGDDKSCGDSENIYTSGGVGGEYMLKPSQRMVVSADYAVGEGDNQGFYLHFGQAF